jgi:hypothetical protein
MGSGLAHSDTEEPALVAIEIGDANLSAEVLREMAVAPSLVYRKHPGSPIALLISGFDDDPRSLWDIPRVAEYVRVFAREAGLADWRGLLFQALVEESRAVLIQCRAIDEPHPFRVEVREHD